MIDEITLKLFSKHDDPELYQKYLKLKFQVFVKELGWHLLAADSDEIAAEDQFDDQGRFMMAMTPAGLPIGVVRGIAIRDGFPHRDLFEHHFLHDEVNSMFSSICTFNALAVLPAYRGKIFRVIGCEWKGSVGKILVLSLILSFQEKSVKAAIATSEGLVSTRFFLRLGFLMIDPPCVTHLHRDSLSNVALIFSSTRHLTVQDDCNMKPDRTVQIDEKTRKLERYFESCQKNVLQSHHFEDLFG